MLERPNMCYNVLFYSTYGKAGLVNTITVLTAHNLNINAIIANS
jgi:hypothetical protein